jgi:enoyl-CoA hydratase
MTDSALPTYHLEDDIAVITMDDGKANVFSNASLEALEALLDRVGSEGARALVLVGRPGRFSAGFDLGEMTSDVETMRALVARGCRWWLRLYGLGIPTVAASTGHALAGGALTLLSCDVRVGAEGVGKVGLNEVAIGMTLPIFAVELARDRLRSEHLWRAITGEVFDPAGAAEVGFLDRVVPADDVLAEALAEARALAERNTTAYGGTKLNLRGEMIERCLAGVDADMARMAGPKV